MKISDVALMDAVLVVLKGRHGIDARIRRDDLRDELVWRTGKQVADREMRFAIESLRGTPQGALICSTTKNGGGYYLARSTDELNEYLMQDESRCLEMWRRCKKQRAAAGIALTGTDAHQLELMCRDDEWR